jgi:hypothetical protein
MDQQSRMRDPVCLAFDVTPDRGWSSIAAAGFRQDGRFHVELVDRRAGTGWVVERIVELCATHRPVGVLCDGRSPAASLVHKLEAAGVAVRVLDSTEHARACGLIVDVVKQGQLRHLGQQELSTAVKGAAKRVLGDAWAWARRVSRVDIAPLVSATLALWGASSEVSPPTYTSGSFA